MIAFAKPQGTSVARSAEELLAEYRATGATAPFEEVVRRYAAMVFNECYAVTKSRHDAEDASQATFLTLAVQARTGDEIRHVGPWLQRVARRVALDQEKSKRRRKKREDNHHTVNGTSGLATAHRESMDQLELRHLINEELQALPAKYRLPLILHYYGGLSREQMAAELKVKPATLGVRLFRAREMLGKRLEKRGLALPAVAIPLMIGLVVRESVEAHGVLSLAASSAQIADAAVRVASGLTPHAGMVSPGALALAEQASHHLILRKVKTVLAAAAIGASALAAGGAQIVHRIQQGTLTIKSLLDFSTYLPEWGGGTVPTLRVDASQKMGPAVPVTDWMDTLALTSLSGDGWHSTLSSVPARGGRAFGADPFGGTTTNAGFTGGSSPEGLAPRMTMVSAPVVADSKGTVPLFELPAVRLTGGVATSENTDLPTARGGDGVSVGFASGFKGGGGSGSGSGLPGAPSWLSSAAEAPGAAVRISATGGSYFMSSSDGGGSSPVALQIKPTHSSVLASRVSGLLITGPVASMGGSAMCVADSQATLTNDGKLLHGYGAPDLMGDVDMSGVVIADGYGEAQVLDLSTADRVYNTVANPPREFNGYYARRGGSLMLPPIAVKAGETSTGYFGTSVSAPESVASKNGGRPDLVNSAKFTFKHVSISDGAEEGWVSVSLLAPDHVDVPEAPMGRDLISVWAITPDYNVGYKGFDFLARYGLKGDDMMASVVGLAVFYCSDDQWVAARSTIDPASRLITALDIPDTAFVALAVLSGRTDASPEGLGLLPEGDGVTYPSASGYVLFASTGSASYTSNGPGEGLAVVSTRVVPEPGAVGMLIAGGLGLLRRRRAVR